MSLARADLELLLRTRRLDHTLTSALPHHTRSHDEYVVGPTGITTLDARLGGGFPRGQLSEIVGSRSSGRASLLMRMLAAATARGELVALVDALDMLDVGSAVAAGVDLDRLLWIRGHVVVSPGLCRDVNQRAMEKALRALTLVLSAGNFGLVVFDAGEAPPEALRRLAFTTWLRLQRMVEGTQTICVLAGSESMARSAAGLTIRLGREGQEGGACGHAESRPCKAEARYQRQCNEDKHGARFRGQLFEGLNIQEYVWCARDRGRTRRRRWRWPRSHRTMPDLYACLYRPPVASSKTSLVAVAQEFSPRYERHHDGLVSIDVSGLERLLGTPRAIAEELSRTAGTHEVQVHVALARTRMAALVLAQARPGVTVVPPGEEAAVLAPVRIDILETLGVPVLPVLKQWGLHTLGEFAALPAADLAARLGQQGRLWQAIARGEDIRPLVPDAPEERFESSLDLEWPIEGIEPLSFVLTRLLEPLSIRLECRDRGAAVLHIALRLVTRSSTGSGREVHARRLELPSPIREARALRTLALIDLESHPPAAAIDRVTVTIDPTPARVLQHTLFTRAHPTPDDLSTLLARLGALVGQDRFGAPVPVDSYRPGVFTTKPFATDHASSDAHADVREPQLTSALRRCRRPVPARVVVDAGRPVRVTTDRRGFAGGRVIACAGPWRTSGEWWAGSACGHTEPGGEVSASVRAGGGAMRRHWDRDEWEIAVTDGAVYRIFKDRETGGWFIDAIVD